MRISDWSSDVCSSDLRWFQPGRQARRAIRPRDHWFDGATHVAPRQGLCREGNFRRGAHYRCRQMPDRPATAVDDQSKIGRASWRERVGQYVWLAVVGVSLKKTKTYTKDQRKRY